MPKSSSTTTINIERYVPVGNKSLIADAPGWHSVPSQQQHQQLDVPSSSGPTCWKCKGSKRVADNNDKKKRKEKKQKSKMISDDVNVPNENAPNPKKLKVTTTTTTTTATSATCTTNQTKTKECTVCMGRGFIQPKKKERFSLINQPGMITKRRVCPQGWENRGPTAYAVQQMKDIFFQNEHENGGADGVSTCTTRTGNDNHENMDATSTCTSSPSLNQNHPLHLLYRANCTPIDGAGVQVHVPKSMPASMSGSPSSSSSSSSSYEQTYPWYPHNHGEQLCNLVGDWRILQKTGSHRWTTDDIVTAYMGIREAMALSISSREESAGGRDSINYLDLGCGNGSVLQMVSWGLWDKVRLRAFGIEARSEAVGLARRSLSFNVGKKDHNDNKGGEEDGYAHVIHGDFRDLNCSKDEFGGGSKGKNNDGKVLEKFHVVKRRSFDLVTGTPPYFRVDFSTDRSHNDGNYTKSSSSNNNGHNGNNNNPNAMVTAAVIRQGGMPTSIQSAPARCEFRGGIEAYCDAAASILSDNGTFVVCENWLNNERVYDGAQLSGLEVVKVLPVKGKRGRKEILFGVYVLQKKKEDDSEKVRKDVAKKGQRQNSEGAHILETLSVRTESGKWTREYADLLEFMSVPGRHYVD